MKKLSVFHRVSLTFCAKLCMMFFFIGFIGVKVYGADRYAVSTGNWNGSIWAATAGGSAGSASTPTITDVVYINNKIVVTLTADASCASLTLNGSSNNTELKIETYTLNVTGNITGSSKKSLLTFTSGTLNLGGSISGLTTFTAGTGTVNFNGSSSQTIPNTSYSFNNITVNNSAGVTFAGAVTATNVAGIIRVQTGTLNTNNYTVTRGASDNTIVDVGSTFNAGTTNILSNTTPGSFTINGNFITANTNGFSGAANTAISSTNSPTISLGANSTIEYNAGAAQTISDRDYANLTISNSTGTKTWSLTATARTISGNLTISANAPFTFGGTNQTLNLQGNWTKNSTGAFTPGTSTININGTTSQTINGSAATSFNNLTISNTSAAVAVNTNINISGALTVNSGAVVTPAAAVVINSGGAAGTITGSGTVQVTRTAATADYSSQYKFNTNTLTTLTVEYAGTAAQTVSALTYGNLKINNSHGVTLANATTVDGTLTFTSGIINTDKKTFTLGSNATVSGAGTGSHVNGDIIWTLSTGNNISKTIPIGDDVNYTPVTVDFASITTGGSLTAGTIGEENPNIIPSELDNFYSVNRYWTLANTGLVYTTYSATFGFVAGDLDAGADYNSFIVGKHDGSTWTYPSVGTKTSTSTQASGMTSMSSFAVAQAAGVPTVTTDPSNSTVLDCSSTTFTSAAHSNPPATVVWQENSGSGFADITPGGIYSVSTSSGGGTTTSTLTINPVSGSMNNYTYRARFTNNKGSATSAAATLTVVTTLTWDGSTSNDWHTTTNWTPEFVPTSCTDVVIPKTGVTNFPTISSSANCNNITIRSNASLLGNSNLTIAGAATMERGVDHSAWRWHFLSSPMPSHAIWPAFAPVPSGSPLNWGSGPSWNWDVYYWNPTVQNVYPNLPWVNIRKTDGSYNDGTVDDSNPSTGEEAGFGSGTPSFTVGRGYMVSYATDYSPSDTIFKFTGTSFNSGNVSYSGINTSGNKFYLIGNPYPSSIDFASSNWGTNKDVIKYGTDYYYWILNDKTGNYGAYSYTGGSEPSGTGTNNTSRYIAPCQSFFVEATGSGTFTMTESLREHSAQGWIKNTEVVNNALRLSLTTDQNSYSDEMIIDFHDAYQDSEGAPKLFSFYTEAPEIWTVKNDKNFSIDHHTGLIDSLTVSVSAKTGVNGLYTIKATNISDFGCSRKVILEDLKTGNKVDLKQNSTYSFTGGPDDNTARFRLKFSDAVGFEEPGTNSQVYAFAYGNDVYVNTGNLTGSSCDVMIYDALGRLVYRNLLSPVTGNYRFTTLNNRGAYIVKIVTRSGIVNSKIIIP